MIEPRDRWGSSFRPLALLLTTAAGLLRLAPHPWNFTPLGAAALFAGGRLRGWPSFLLPFALLAGTDAVINWRHGYRPIYPEMPFVYAAFLVSIIIGKTLVTSESPWRIGLASLLASGQFFLLTNFGVWLVSGIYPPTLDGLAGCFVAGLPFFRNTLLGDLAYTALLFGSHALLSRLWYPAERVPAGELAAHEIRAASVSER